MIAFVLHFPARPVSEAAAQEALAGTTYSDDYVNKTARELGQLNSPTFQQRNPSITAQEIAQKKLLAKSVLTRSTSSASPDLNYAVGYASDPFVMFLGVVLVLVALLTACGKIRFSFR